LISIAQCKNKQQPSPGWFYDTWGAGQSAYVLATHTITSASHALVTSTVLAVIHSSLR